MPVRADVCDDAKRRADLVVSARIVQSTVRTGTGASVDSPVYQVVGTSVVVPDVVEFVGFVYVVGEPVELPAEAQVVLLTDCARQIAPAQR